MGYLLIKQKDTNMINVNYVIDVKTSNDVYHSCRKLNKIKSDKILELIEYKGKHQTILFNSIVDIIEEFIGKLTK